MLSHKCKYGKVQDDGYQYCQKCGIAIKPVNQCEHKWERVGSGPLEKYIFNNLSELIFVVKCEKCGVFNKFEVGK